MQQVPSLRHPDRRTLRQVCFSFAIGGEKFVWSLVMRGIR